MSRTSSRDSAPRLAGICGCGRVRVEARNDGGRFVRPSEPCVRLTGGSLSAPGPCLMQRPVSYEEFRGCATLSIREMPQGEPRPERHRPCGLRVGVADAHPTPRGPLTTPFSGMARRPTSEAIHVWGRASSGPCHASSEPWIRWSSWPQSSLSSRGSRPDTLLKSPRPYLPDQPVVLQVQLEQIWT